MPLILIRSPMNMFYTEIMGDIDEDILRVLRLREGWNERDWNFVVALKRSKRHITTINLMVPDVLTIICSEFDFEMVRSTVYLAHPEGEHFLLYILQKVIDPKDLQEIVEEEAAKMDISTETTSLYDETYKNKGTMTEYDKRFYIERDLHREIGGHKRRAELPHFAYLPYREGIEEESQDQKDQVKKDQALEQTEEKEALPTTSEEVQDETNQEEGTNAQVEPSPESRADEVKTDDERVESGLDSETMPIETESSTSETSKKSRRKLKKEKKKSRESDKAGIAEEDEVRVPESETPTPIIYKDDSKIPHDSTAKKQAEVKKPTGAQKRRVEIPKIRKRYTTPTDESKPSRPVYKEASTQSEEFSKSKGAQSAEAGTSTHKGEKADISTGTEHHFVKPIGIGKPSPLTKFDEEVDTEQSNYLARVEDLTLPAVEHATNVALPTNLSKETVEMSTSSETDVDTVKERSATVMIVEESVTKSEGAIEESNSLPEIIEAPTNLQGEKFGTVGQTKTSRSFKPEPSTSTQKEKVVTDHEEKSTQQPKDLLQSTHSEIPDVMQLTQTVMLTDLPQQSMEGDTYSFNRSSLRRRRLLRRRRKYDVKEVIDRIGSSQIGSSRFKRKHSTSGSSEDAFQEDPNVVYVTAETPSKSIFDYVIDLPRKLSEKLLSFLSGSSSQMEQQTESPSVSRGVSEPVPSTSKVDESVAIDLGPSTSDHPSGYTFLHPPTELPFRVSKVPLGKSTSTPSISRDLYRPQRSKEIPPPTSRKFGVLELKRYDTTATTSIHIERETTSRESKPSTESFRLEREPSMIAIHGSESSRYDKPSSSSSNEM